jgi:hypothetical protein
MSANDPKRTLPNRSLRLDWPNFIAEWRDWRLDSWSPGWQATAWVIRGEPMKKFVLAVALVVTSLSLAGCFVGKGKAPPPVVTKG